LKTQDLEFGDSALEGLQQQREETLEDFFFGDAFGQDFYFVDDVVQGLCGHFLA